MPQPTIQQTFELALEHHQSGRMREAEQLYRQVLLQHPAHVDALHNLGVLALQSGRNDIAADLFRRTIALNPRLPQAHGNLGIALRNLGQLDDAITALRHAIQLNPQFTEAHNNLADSLKVQGKLQEAISEYRQALALNPKLPHALNNLGNALKESGALEESIDCFRQAIALNPAFHQAHSNLAVALRDQGKLDEAETTLHEAIRLQPNYPEAHNNLARILEEKGQLDQAIAEYQQALNLKPDYHEAYNNLSVALKAKGQLEEATAAIRRAIELKPNYAEAYVNLANIQKEQGRLEESIATYRKAIVLNPTYAPAHYNLGIALMETADHAAAVAAYERAIELKPDYADAYNNLGIALKDQCLLESGLAALRKALALKPDSPQTHSNLILSMLNDPKYQGQPIAEESRRWNDRHAKPLARFIRHHTNDKNPDRRLRIGYVSPDFKNHVVGRFVLPLFEHHDHEQFEIFAYSNVLAPDELTVRFRTLSNQWRDIARVSDPQAAEMIRADAIDILVDLAGHTGGTRLLIFAQKPAPIQLSYLGYAASTGLDTIDSRLSDSFADPPELTDPADRVTRLPRTNWCFTQTEDSSPVEPPPVIRSGHVTFGCLNTFSKLNDELLNLWSRVLASTPTSRLLLLAPVGERRNWVLEKLAVDPARVQFVPRQPRVQYLQTYHQVDIALDTFPYHGTTTTCDALWMGVPVVTLAGRHHVSRVSVSVLSNIGLPELIANSPDQYVQIAADLACEVPRLESLRQGMRARMSASSLMDAAQFARDIESVYRQAWQVWCRSLAKS